MGRLAIFGGTFNPIHIGHISVAKQVHEELGYDQVVLVPNGVAPLKSETRGAKNVDRMAMALRAVVGLDYIRVSAFELVHPGTSYSIDTVKAFSYGRKKIGLIIGADQAAQFKCWKDWGQILDLAEVIVARRGEPVDVDFPHIQLENALLDVSSTRIREDPDSNRAFLCENVFSYIKQNKLYFERKEHENHNPSLS